MHGSAEQIQLDNNTGIGFEDPQTGVQAEQIFAAHEQAVDQLTGAQATLSSEQSKVTAMQEAASLLVANGVEVDNVALTTTNSAQLVEQKEKVQDADKSRKAALWDSSQHYKNHEEEYRVSAVNEAAKKGIQIDTTLNGEPIMPVEHATTDAQDNRKTIQYGGKQHNPTIRWR
jgi:DNA repair ATPase RecN